MTLTITDETLSFIFFYSVVQDVLYFYIRQSKFVNSRLFIDLELRYNPYFKKIKELLSSIGHIYYVEMFFQSSLYLKNEIRNSWNYDEKVGGGIIMAIFPHFLDLLLYWFNPQCHSIRSKSLNLHNEHGSSEFCTVSLYMKNNITVSLTATAILEGNKELNIIIIGTQGKIEFNLESLLLLNGENIPVCLPDYYLTEDSIFRSSFACYAHELVNAIKEQRSPKNYTTATQIHTIHKLLEDIKLSSQYKKEIFC